MRVWDAPAVIEVLDNATASAFTEKFVLRALLGRSVGWDAQPRGDRGVPWREALRRHKWHLSIGLVWGGAILALAPNYIWWMSPVILGMLLSVPLTVLTSRSDLGLALRRHGWLLTPEETHEPYEMATAAAARERGLAPASDVAPEAMPQRAPLPMMPEPAAYLRLRIVPRRRVATSL